MMDLNPDLDLELFRTLAVPPALVWRCWTEPALLCQWFCPKPWSVSEAVIDLRAGGRFFTMMRGPDGEAVPNEGSFLEVVPDRKLVFTDIFAADFAPLAQVQSGAQLGFAAILTFDPDRSGTTRYRAVVRHRTAADAEKHRKMGFHDGWGTAATQLEELAKTLEDHQISLTRLIAAPPATVWRAFTDPALLPQWFGPDGFTCTTKEIDLRQGGVWRFDMVGHGMTFANRHRYTLHQPFERIEFLMDGDDDAEAPMRVVVTLAPEGSATRITQVITLADAAAKAEKLAFGADRLGLQTLAKLAALVERL